MVPTQSAVARGKRPMRPPRRIASPADIGRPKVPALADARGRIRARLGADDVYIDAMMREQARQFLTEGDNRIHTPRLPSPYRRALAPDPTGPQRPGIAYCELAPGDPAQPAEPTKPPGLWHRVRDQARKLWAAWTQRPLTPPGPVASDAEARDSSDTDETARLLSWADVLAEPPARNGRPDVGVHVGPHAERRTPAGPLWADDDGLHDDYVSHVTDLT